MEEINPNHCADLERLASAAVTMGYSSTQIINNSNSSLSSDSVPTTTILPEYISTQYEIPRTQQYSSVRFYPSRPMYDQNRTEFAEVTPQHLINSTHSVPSLSRIGANYTVIQRADLQTHIPSCNQQYSQDVSTKNLGFTATSSGTSIHYIDARSIPINIDARSIPINIDAPGTIQSPTIITVSQAPSLQVGSQISSQPLIHLVQQEVPVAMSLNSSEMVTMETGTNIVVVPVVNPEKKSKSKKRRTKLKSDKSLKREESKKMLDEIPEPKDINGKKYFLCSLCNEKFLRKYMFHRHQIFHTGEKRGALSLETKAEIIRRIKAGEKQVDLAMEYHVGRSTLSFIMKNSEKFLLVLQNGKFLPDSKRLRGAHREDVEEALYEWYKQAIVLGVNVSGPILCRKAKDFALKLGYNEFKATHGWLDRFKHRKQITLGRGKIIKDKDQNDEETEEFKEDFADLILPNILIEYDSNDVFYASEIGLLYRLLPDEAFHFRDIRCGGGSHSRKRITVLLCANMTGSEKFPVLVVGKCPKPKCFKNVKSLPVHYLTDEKSWMNKTNFNAWLTDMNSWFQQQNRKVLLVIPNLPIHPKSCKLSAVRLVVSPSNFVGPSKLGITQSLKRNYRRGILEYFLQSIDNVPNMRKKSRKHTFKPSLLTCLHKLAVAWHAVTDVTISNSFQRSGLGKYGLWGINLLSETNLGTENLDLMHRLKENGLKIPDSFIFDDYVSFDDNVQVCHFMNDDDIIATVMKEDRESGSEDDDYDEDGERLSKRENKENSDEDYRGPSFSDVKTNLQIIKNHIAYQTRGSQEMITVFSHLEYLLKKTVDNMNIIPHGSID